MIVKKSATLRRLLDQCSPKLSVVFYRYKTLKLGAPDRALRTNNMTYNH